MLGYQLHFAQFRDLESINGPLTSLPIGILEWLMTKCFTNVLWWRCLFIISFLKVYIFGRCFQEKKGGAPEATGIHFCCQSISRQNFASVTCFPKSFNHFISLAKIHFTLFFRRQYFGIIFDLKLHDPLCFLCRNILFDRQSRDIFIRWGELINENNAYNQEKKCHGLSFSIGRRCSTFFLLLVLYISFFTLYWRKLLSNWRYFEDINNRSSWQLLGE